VSTVAWGGEGKFTFFGDVVPIAVVEGDLGFGRLSYELFHVVRAEWGVSAEKHVGDDPVRVGGRRVLAHNLS
jgi:hypothetical protein